eukprot:g8496.t1
MWQDPPGWERHKSKRDGALFLHNPATGESEWFTGWVQRTSKWYGRTYWFQPTTGRAEWELPPPATAASDSPHTAASPFVQSSVVPKPSSEKVKSWKEKILAAKAKANAAAAAAGSGGGSPAAGGGGDAPPPPPPPRGGSGGGGGGGDDDSSGDDMEVDAEIAGGVELLSPSDIAPAADLLLEDVPSVSLRREELRRECLQRFADANFKIGGKMMGNSKTCRSCREDGMVVGLSGMFGRWLWVQHMRQTMALASGTMTRTSKLPPDPVFPSLEDTDEKLVRELVEGKRSRSQAQRVLQELSGACKEASVELEVLLQAELPGLKMQEVILEEEAQTSRGDTSMRHVTGKGARVPGPNPNASYRLRYIPSKQSSSREGASFAITGAHLHKTWAAYGRCAQEGPPVWDPDFLRRLFCVLSRYETLSATSDGYQMAFPASGFRLLRHLVSVECECFASPLNCTLPRFCSVAFDTDKFFGSEGNFFQSEYQQGSFEANPPFVEEVMERMVDHMHDLLERATGPMSFAVIVPGWDDEGCASYQNMKRSRFARPQPGFHLTLKKGMHNYRPGMQHRQDVEEKPSNCNTFLFILQNDWGASTWPVSTSSLSQLQAELESEAKTLAARN